MASLEDRFVNERRQEPDSDEEAGESFFAEADGATVERLRPVQDGGMQTGPKGVLKDRQRALQQEAEERLQRLERLEKVAEKLVVGRPEEDGKAPGQEGDENDMSTEDKAFLQKYREQRIREMQAAASQPRFEKTFGTLEHLVNRTYVSTIDKELPSVYIVVHIYDSFLPDSVQINQCLATLAAQYPMVKFCKILGIAANVSENFLQHGIPAILIYQGGKLIGNYPAITQTVSEITPESLADFLKQNNCMPDVEPRDASDLESP